MDRSELAIVALVLTGIALVLTAPMLGRSGFTVFADLTMAFAALAGVSAFAIVSLQTLRSARGRSASGDRKEAR